MKIIHIESWGIEIIKWSFNVLISFVNKRFLYYITNLTVILASFKPHPPKAKD
jgi:hypothetical protein